MAVASNSKNKPLIKPAQKQEGHPTALQSSSHSSATSFIKPKILTWLFTALLISGIWWAWEPLSEFAAILGDQEAVSASLRSYGALGPIVLALAQLIQIIIAVVPGHVFLIAAGYVYGFPLGFLMNIVYIVAGSQIGFLLARWAGRPVVNRLANPELVDKWERLADERGVLFFTIAFVLPVFPTDVMNFVAGLTGMSSRKFLVANFFGRLPGAVMLTLIGSHGLELSATSWWIMGIFVVILYIGGRTFISRLEKRYAKQTKGFSNP